MSFFGKVSFETGADSGKEPMCFSENSRHHHEVEISYDHFFLTSRFPVDSNMSNFFQITVFEYEAG